MLFCGWLIVGHVDGDAGALAEARQEGLRSGGARPFGNREETGRSRRATACRYGFQTDPQWDYVPYAGGTIGDYGCGLTCAAMAIKYMTLQDITPLTLASFVGDACLTDGVNDPGKFCTWIAEHYPEYGIESTPISTISRPSFRTFLADGLPSLA